MFALALPPLKTPKIYHRADSHRKYTCMFDFNYKQCVLTSIVVVESHVAHSIIFPARRLDDPNRFPNIAGAAELISGHILYAIYYYAKYILMLYDICYFELAPFSILKFHLL